MAMSVRAVHCISDQEKVFPQTLSRKPSWVTSKGNEFRFGAHNSKSGKRRKLAPGQTRKLYKLATSLLKNHNTQQKSVIIFKLRGPSRV